MDQGQALTRYRTYLIPKLFGSHSEGRLQRHLQIPQRTLRQQRRSHIRHICLYAVLHNVLGESHLEAQLLLSEFAG